MAANKPKTVPIPPQEVKVPLVDGLVAGAVADGDGIDAHVGGDGAADGAGAGVYVVLARERPVDELPLLGGAGRARARWSLDVRPKMRGSQPWCWRRYAWRRGPF